MQSVRKPRIESIDLLRGLVIILMALDHVRMYFGEGGFYADPTNLDTTTPLLFFTRWITHFCAPVFIFLAGTSAALYGARQAGASQPNTRDVSHYVLTRGLWLIFLEFVIVNFGWTFDPTFSFHFLQVIWAIGASMVVLAGPGVSPEVGDLRVRDSPGLRPQPPRSDPDAGHEPPGHPLVHPSPGAARRVRAERRRLFPLPADPSCRADGPGVCLRDPLPAGVRPRRCGGSGC